MLDITKELWKAYWRKCRILSGAIMESAIREFAYRGKYGNLRCSRDPKALKDWRGYCKALCRAIRLRLWMRKGPILTVRRFTVSPDFTLGVEGVPEEA